MAGFYLGWNDGSGTGFYRSFYLNSPYLADWMQSTSSSTAAYRWDRRDDASSKAAELNKELDGYGFWNVLEDAHD